MIICGGGTGGHIYPGFAVAEALIDHEPGTYVHFVVGSKALEARIMSTVPWDYSILNIYGMPRKPTLKMFSWVWSLAGNTREAVSILRREKPNVILGTGGYVSGPLLIAALLKRVPFLILVPDRLPGITNRFLGKFARQVLVGHEDAAKYFNPKKVVFTGNPLRRKLINDAHEKDYGYFNLDPAKFTVLIFGGSQGAGRINETIISTLDVLKEKGTIDTQFIILTGARDHKKVEDKVRDTGIPAFVSPLLEEMGLAYGVADLVVSRAGAFSIAEITATGCPAIMVPLPHATGGHQLKNSRELESAGAARVILEDDLNPEILARNILELKNNPELLKNMRNASKMLGHENAADDIADIIERCSQIKKSGNGNVNYNA